MAQPRNNMKPKLRPPFEFVIEALKEWDPNLLIRPMFGCHALYSGERMLLILRSKADHRDDNGIWIATQFEHHPSLKKEFPVLRDILMFDSSPTVWQNLPENSDHFEEDAARIIDLVISGDDRIGKIP